MADKAVATVCVMVLLFFTVLGQVIVGGTYYNDCPGHSFIPIYLCGPIFAFFVLWMYGSCNWICWSGTTLFFLCWYITGNVVIYSNYEPDYNRCNKTLYLFAFWSTIVTNIWLFGLLCSHCYYSAQEDDHTNIEVQT